MDELEKLQAALDLDVTHETLARVSGMSQQAISKYRTGQSQAENMRFKNSIKLIKYWEELQMRIENLSTEEFYLLDEVSIESDGFYYVDEENEINEMVPTPEEAFLPEEEWNGEDYSDHLHPAYLPAWKELQEKVIEAYK